MSCGQCFPCRLGTQQLAKIMERICGGKGDPARPGAPGEPGQPDIRHRPLRHRPHPGPPHQRHPRGPAHRVQTDRGQRPLRWSGAPTRPWSPRPASMPVPPMWTCRAIWRASGWAALDQAMAKVQERLPHARHHRPGVRAPLRGQLPPQPAGPAFGHPLAQALFGRPGDERGHRPARDARRVQGAQGGRGGGRSGRLVLRLLPGAPGLSHHRLRGPGRPRRHGRLRHRPPTACRARCWPSRPPRWSAWAPRSATASGWART